MRHHPPHPHVPGAVLLASLALASAASAGDPAPPTWHQLTDAPLGFTVFEPAVSADGSRVAFSTNFDGTGGNPENNFEIYLCDHQAHAMVQLTSTPNGIGNFEPLITPDGAVVVFRSKFDFTGQNADGSFELFQVTVDTGEFVQLTDTPSITTLADPAISGDGTHIAFRSNANPLGLNPEFNYEVFRVNRLTLELDQLTTSTFGFLNETPSLNHDGSRVIFRSRFNADGSNPNENMEVWCHDDAVGIFAVTASEQSGQSEYPDADDAGTTVAFLSTNDFTGQNAESSREVFIVNTATGEFTQVTMPGIFTHLAPVMSPMGDFVLFESQRDITGDNPDTNRELFRYDLATKQLTQVTDTTGGSSVARLTPRAMVRYAEVSQDGLTFAYRSEHDLINGGGTSNMELYRADHDAPPTPCPHDLDDDGFITSADLNILLSAFGEADPPAGDINADGTCDSLDLNIVLAAFAAPCPE